jgi:hypothetical protein
LGPRNREQFTGWIAGFGTDSGYRVVTGHWHTSPYSAVTNVMVEDPAGHRTLYGPTPHLAELLTAACDFQDVHVATLQLLHGRVLGTDDRLTARPAR